MTNLEPGVELDCKVAHILGWTGVRKGALTGGLYGKPPNCEEITGGVRLPHFSTDSGAAIEALEEFCRGRELVASIVTDGEESRVDIKHVSNPLGLILYSAVASLPHAISLAIVRAAEALKGKPCES